MASSGANYWRPRHPYGGGLGSRIAVWDAMGYHGIAWASNRLPRAGARVPPTESRWPINGMHPLKEQLKHPPMGASGWALSAPIARNAWPPEMVNVLLPSRALVLPSLKRPGFSLRSGGRARGCISDKPFDCKCAKALRSVATPSSKQVPNARNTRSPGELFSNKEGFLSLTEQTR